MEEAKVRASAKRLEDLHRWKKDRDLARMKAKAKSKKPFIPAGLNCSSVSKLTSSRPTSASEKSESCDAASKSASSGILLRNRTVKPPVPKKPVKLVQDTGIVGSEMESSRKRRPPVAPKPARLKSASSGVSKSVVCNGSMRGPTTRSRAVSANAIVSPVPVQKVSERTPISRPPLAPKPSPEVLRQKLIFANDPAWIPGQKFAASALAPTDPKAFETVFGKHQLFSPFVFTGCKKKTPTVPELPGFTFRLECADSPDCSMVEERDRADTSTTSVTAIANNSTSYPDNVGTLDISDSTQDKVNATICHNNEVANRLVADDDENTAETCPVSPVMHMCVVLKP